MKACTAVVHAGPALGAAFTQYTAEFDTGGELGSTAGQRFIYVVEGAVTVELDGKRSESAHAGTPISPRVCPSVAATTTSRVAVFEKPYKAVNPSNHVPIVSSEHEVSSHALNDDSDLQVKCLLPDELSLILP